MLRGLSSRLSVALVSSWLLACGSDAPPRSDATPNGAARTTPPGAPSGSPTTPAPQGEAPLAGLWEVAGKDARGDYVGEVEIRSDGAGYTFIRNVRYPGVTVEDGRELHWLFRGKLADKGGSLSLEASLRRIDFINKRGAVERTINDGPIALSGTFTKENGAFSGTITGTGISLSETWRARKDLPPVPIFEEKRKLVGAHDPLPTSEKQLLFGLYKDFHGLDVVKPYASRPEFKDALHGHWIDTTDLEFYRQNPNALRVADKIIDDISLGETRARADAFRYTLAKKAELYDRDMETRFIDPDIGMVPDSGAPGAGYAGQSPSHDSALWTGVYMASQVFRHQVTGSAVAKENAIRALNALLILQEITNDWKQFARVLRKATGNPEGDWRAGTGAFAHLEWKAGGNNDMIKGLFYGQVLGWELLCEGGKTGHEAMCERIRVNAKHLADDVVLGGSNAPAAQYTNKLPAAWIAAVTAEDIGDKITYQAKANTYWTAGKAILDQTADSSVQGKVDGSGVHLGSIGDLVGIMLAKRMNLGGNADATYRSQVDRSYASLKGFRLPEWDLLAAVFGSGAGNAATVKPYVDNAVSRLVEATYPKISYNIDRRISPEFCMSPFPSHPWKNDWMQYPSADRTTGLRSYPLFEMGPDILYWKINNRYRSFEGYEPPGYDYLHLYWFARKYGLLGAND